MKNREIVELEFDSWNNFLDSEEYEEYKTVEEKILDTDVEKGIIYWRIILQRTTDNKYFEVLYTQYNYVGDNFRGKLTEVFPKQVTTTIYD